MNRLQLFIVMGMLVLLFACRQKKEQATTSDPDIYYTCSMDPQVVESKPGKCPICHMELTAVHKSQQQNSDQLKLSPGQMHLGNITTDTIRPGYTGSQLVLTATLNTDQSKTNAVSARIGGRIDHLYFKNIGDYIPKGAKLFDLYSEELNNAKQEYLLVLQKQKALGNSIVDYHPLIEAARNKLLLWGMSDAQVTELVKNGTAGMTTTFYSPAGGTIVEQAVKEGDYVTEGGTVVRMADLSTLWAEAQVYTSQLAQFDRKAAAIVHFPDLPEKPPVQGAIDFVNPEVDPDNRINLIRITLSNKDRLLKPGMSAYVTIRDPQRKILSLPIDAVLRNGKMAVVWVETAQNTFKSRMVDTGQEGDGLIEIRSGLQPGDIVVITGAYLLQSEYIFRKGSSPMGGMDMSNMKM
ncbi:efflux RND transporter periplasmic adaptor subunit [Flavitalea sp. BT771]|uniref:efflux RND transporter periplasmic adaptor subunit n=1 Tax=Flavitalea sp. BT771 TaxID=3063329 RepID=UPI0026E2C47B|nr:efflux RND transporter periplasmic adaptor subunit [Flavitalea sp. BT771]MDO6429970.1 efflux RND transporter periplasmic adaptor subunit [Flavitalea sp. BT771]MDV6217902.1 efflux RND transporter periplasmic adaptor subunit [Flavitalea sp. BT771]